MISLDFLQFDQMNLWFFLAAALGLIRERKILPFLIVAVGSLIHGSLPAALVASLILWHRMDLSTPKWVQLKDALGLFFVFAAIVAPEPFQSFSICFGALVLSLCFGMGELGVIPAILLLRQYVSHPADFEVLLGVGAFYPIAIEVIRLTKTPHAGAIRGTLVALCSLGVLYGLKDVFAKWIEDPICISVGATLVVFMLVIASLVHWKRESFWSFYRSSKQRFEKMLTVGDRIVSARPMFHQEAISEPRPEISTSFDRIFILAIFTAALLGAFVLFGRGGMS